MMLSGFYYFLSGFYPTDDKMRENRLNVLNISIVDQMMW